MTRLSHPARARRPAARVDRRLVRLSAGGPCAGRRRRPGARALAPRPAQIAAVRAEAGLDRPLVVQYGPLAVVLVRGDLGTSFRYRAPVGPMVLDRAINTAVLALTALLLALVIGLPPAVSVGDTPEPRSPRAQSARSRCCCCRSRRLSARSCWYMVAARTGWLPAGGMTSGADFTGFRRGWPTCCGTCRCRHWRSPCRWRRRSNASRPRR